MDFTGPTPEQLEKDIYEPPQRDQRTNRTAWRKKPAYERIRLEEPQRQALRKLDRHMHGSTGADVRVDDAPADGPADEFAISRHARELDIAKRQMPAKCWAALMATLTETMTPQDLGVWCGFKDRAQAYAAGVTLIQTGADALATHWGLIRRPDG